MIQPIDREVFSKIGGSQQDGVDQYDAYELSDEIADALKNRDDWYRRAGDVLQNASHGLRRVSPPYPGAADLHFPLIDSIVERLKPFYYSQLSGATNLPRSRR